MSQWTHSICEDCWDKKNPTKLADRHGPGDDDICCFCQKKHNSGIYIRENPDNLTCKGAHVSGSKEDEE